MRINDDMIYLTDNGAALCGAHLGACAKARGRDLSGQPIEPITPELARECQRVYGYLPSCERCGKVASLIAPNVPALLFAASESFAGDEMAAPGPDEQDFIDRLSPTPEDA